MKNLFFRRFCSSAPSVLSCSSFPLKQVTKNNFTSCLTELLSLIRNCSFVAVDLEMTGVTSSPWRESFDFDSPSVRYLKVKHSAENFAVVQFGLCPFLWDPNRLTYVAYPHNFSLFPGEETFLCQTTSLNFLASYQFDFNNCLHSGITYTSRIKEESSLRLLDHNYETKEDDEPTATSLNSVTNIFFSKRMEDQLTQWREGLMSSGCQSSLKTIFFKGRPALSLDSFTPHQIRILQLVVHKRFKDLELVRVHGENPRPDRFIVFVDSQEDKELLRKEVRRDKYEAEKAKISSEVGFRYVIDFLSSEKKLVVGHNCFLDFAHIYSKFLGDLPQTAGNFASSLNQHFPIILDTKVVLNSNALLQVRLKNKNTSLSTAFASLCSQNGSDSENSPYVGVKIDVQVDDQRHSHWNSGLKHEAGYDAFMTGCVFAQACYAMGVNVTSNCEKSCDLNEKLQKHANRLYLSWTGGDIINLNNGEISTESILSKKIRVKIAYDHTVLIWGFSSHLTNKEIKKCITKALGPFSVTSVLCIDETAVIVVFNKDECVGKLIGIKELFESTHESACVLHPMWKVFEGGRTCVASYEAYEEICSSSVSEMLFADQAEACEEKWKVKGKNANGDVFLVSEVIEYDEGKMSVDNAC